MAKKPRVPNRSLVPFQTSYFLLTSEEFHVIVSWSICVTNTCTQDTLEIMMGTKGVYELVHLGSRKQTQNKLCGSNNVGHATLCLFKLLPYYYILKPYNVGKVHLFYPI